MYTYMYIYIYTCVYFTKNSTTPFCLQAANSAEAEARGALEELSEEHEDLLVCLAEQVHEN